MRTTANTLGAYADRFTQPTVEAVGSVIELPKVDEVMVLVGRTKLCIVVEDIDTAGEAAACLRKIADIVEAAG